jgi:site-specific DNA recombinase
MVFLPLRGGPAGKTALGQWIWVNQGRPFKVEVKMSSKVDSAYIYARKSEEDSDRQVQSIADQIAVALELAMRDEHRVQPSHTLQEERSAKAPGRPVFNELMEVVERNPHTTIYCWKFDRLTRNPIDEGRLKWLIQQGKLTIITPYQRFDQNTNVIVTSVEGAQGNQYLIDLSRAVKRGNEGKRARGQKPGLVRAGYINAGERKGERWVEADPDRFDLVQRAFRLILAGTPPMEALRVLNDEWGFRTIKRRRVGGGPISKATWYEMLRDPLYFAKFIHNGEWCDGTHPAAISEEEFWQIQGILGEKGRPRLRSDEIAAYLGEIKCGECGGSVTLDHKQQVRCLCGHKYSSKHRSLCPKCGLPSAQVPEERHHEYFFYRCTKQKKGTPCCQPSITLEELERQILSMLDTITIPPEFVAWGLEYLDSKNDEEVQSREQILSSLQKAYEAKEQEINRHNRMYVRGLIDEDEEESYLAEKRRLTTERNQLRSQIEKLEKRADSWRERTEGLFDFASHAKDLIEHGDNRTKTRILRELGVNALLKEKKLMVEIDPVLILIQDGLQDIREKFPSVEPTKIGELTPTEANKSLVTAVKLSWLPGSDSNRRPID